MMRLALLLVAACGTTPGLTPRFVNAPPVGRVNDRLDVPKPPREIKHRTVSYNYDSYYLLAERRFNLTRSQRARGVNSIDEVPDSTWFTNRIGVRDVTADEIRRGPTGPESPEAYKPWTIESGKSGGMAIGFVAHDTRGERFVLKFDEAPTPEVETGASPVVGRLLWAAGYNVPSEHVVYLRREDLVIAPNARAGKRKLDQAFLDGKLAKVAVDGDGRIRALASMFIAGKPLGGAPRLGVRPDDPNDTIPHELRRDLRGFRAFAAWLAHADLKEDNTLDAWQEDPKNPRIHYVVHYQIDFGKALGGMARVNRRWSADYAYHVDLEDWTASLMSLGLWRQPWEGRPVPPLRGVGLYSAVDYDPAGWKPDVMSQFPVIFADRFDQFWGAKILIRFTRAQIEAAVEAGRYTDPRATRYLAETIIARQRITARHWFRQVNPLDDFTIADGTLCFTDLALLHHLEREPTHYTAQLRDDRGHALGTRTTQPDAIGRACVGLVALGRGRDHYTILRIASSRAVPALAVHVATDARGASRVIGIHRE